MNADTILLVVLILQAEAFTGLICLQIAGIVSEHRAERRQPDVDRAREIVLRSVFTGRVLPDVLPRLQRLGAKVRLRLLDDLAGEFTGSDRQIVAQIAKSSGALQRAGRNLRHRDWRIRLSGVNALAALGVRHRRSVRFLADPAPAVRAAATQWVSETETTSESRDDALRAVAELLMDPHPMVRFAARVALLTAGQAAADLLLEHADGSSPIPPATVLSLGFPTPEFVELAVNSSHDPDPTLRRATVPVLAKDGGPQAKEALRLLLEDPDHQVRRTAARAMAAAGATDCVRAVARHARLDPDGLVRDGCLRALPDLGPAGQLALSAVAGEYGSGPGPAGPRGSGSPQAGSQPIGSGSVS